MTYYKLGCNWGPGKPDFYKLLKQYSIVICAGEAMQKDDFVVIAQGFNVIALAQISSNLYPCTSKPELEKDFANYDIDYEDWNNIANAEIWELPQEDKFKYQERKGICQIQNETIIEKAKTLIHNILSQKMVTDCKKLLLGNYNIVLTGAPGTGKTYLAKEIAKEMGATEDNGTCKLVQFHPSYDYTDFVEGLRPIKRNGELGFQRKDGVFKRFCKEALVTQNTVKAEETEKITIEMVKMYFNDLWNDIRSDKVAKIKLSSGKNSLKMIVDDNNKETIHFSSKDNPNAISEGNDVTINDITNIIFDNHINTIESLIDAGPKRETLGVGGNTSNKWAVCKYILDKCQHICTSECPTPFVFIIDEINRGEISKIFGELFYSIDSGYRGTDGIVDTQYQNLIPKEGDKDFDPQNADVFRNGFYIPENVYIIGTMNDIDRSVESMDFAMRRRFAWKEIKVEKSQSMLEDEKAWDGNKPNQETITIIKNKMNNLNACIIDEYNSKEKELSSKDKIGFTTAYQIGASYFLKLKNYLENGIATTKSWDNLWDNHLEGLLREYLRGTSNIENKIERLKAAFDDTTDHNETTEN